MAIYVMCTNSWFSGEQLYQPGDKVTLPDDAIPSRHMRPVDAAAKRAWKRCFPDAPFPELPDFFPGTSQEFEEGVSERRQRARSSDGRGARSSDEDVTAGDDAG